MKLCRKILKSNRVSKYDPRSLHRCYRLDGHTDACAEYPYLRHLNEVAKRVSNKIIRDATKTTGASWKSEDAGPNRISRWTMLLSDVKLKKLGINMSKLKPLVIAKLRDKAASYDDCMEAAQKLTWLAYGMVNAPKPPDDIKSYLEANHGSIISGSTVCLICRDKLNFKLFDEARRGKAEIETSHATPRSHTKDNVGFAHRACNIAQGDKSLEEFYAWIRSILERVYEQ